MPGPSDPSLPAKIKLALGGLKGVYMAGEDLLGRAVQRAPKDEGTLRGSASLVLIVNRARFEGEGSLAAAGERVRAIVTAGQPLTMSAQVRFSTVYAARQHEETTWRHREGEAKYLQRPLTENAARYRDVIQKAARFA